MGEVFRAHDVRLKRDVALKVLPISAVSDPDRRSRFDREAQVLASLNHPNIAQVFGVEDADGAPVIVMELVEGPTLADRLAKGALPIDEALPIASQMCDGLEAAHERGIIHRDLKPANIKVRADGAIKILDFGLARVLAGDAPLDPGQSPTMAPPDTGVGIVLGTAAYMSPEQARGRAVDKRTDIWAFGCVVYEMLTGQPVFSGESTTDVLAAVVQRDPDLSLLPPRTPSRIVELLRRCLQKNPKDRLRDIADARFEIEQAKHPPSGVFPAAICCEDISRVGHVWSRIVIALARDVCGWSGRGGGTAVCRIRPAAGGGRIGDARPRHHQSSAGHDRRAEPRLRDRAVS